MNDPIREHEVVLVLADEFVSRVAHYALHYHVWALKTPTIEEIANEYWDKHPPSSDGTGISLFSGVGTPEEDLLSIIDTIELHHGIASSGPTVGTIRVLGAQPTDRVREVISTLGFTQIEPIEDGFVARWHQR